VPQGVEVRVLSLAPLFIRRSELKLASPDCQTKNPSAEAKGFFAFPNFQTII